MAKRTTEPPVVVLPVSSKKQLLRIDAVCKFLGGISADVLQDLRNDQSKRFPKPLQMFGGNKPVWTVEQIEKYIAAEEKSVASLNA